jgi:iron(III) transport system substrate-binding protein
MRSTRFTLVAAVAVMAMLAASCSSDTADTTTTTAAPTTTTTGAPGDTTTTTAAPTADEIFQAEWDALVAAAQAEGELVMVLSTNNAASQQPVFDKFGEIFGINMVYAVGSTSEMNTRVLAERSQGIYDVDVSVMGTSASNGFLEGGAVADLASLLIDPSIADRSLWFLEDFPWLPTDETQSSVTDYLLRNEPNITRVFYNTDVLTEDVWAGVDSFLDFIDDPQFQGRIVIANVFDESSDGTSNALGRLWLKFEGPEFFDRLFNDNPPDVVATGDARTIVDGIARGEWDLCFLCDIVSSDAAQAAEDGLPIAQLTKTLAEGPNTDLTGHTLVFDQAKNPAAAQLFINWILSTEGHTTINELIDPAVSEGVQGLRKDAPQGAIPDDTWAVTRDPYVAILLDPTELRAARDEAHAYVIQLGIDLGLTAG